MIKQNIQNDMIDNLKKSDTTAVKVLRFVLSEIQYAEIDKRNIISDEDVISLLRKEIKKRKEAIELFKKGNRNDLVDDELNQINIIERYLPQELSDEEVESAVDEVLKDIGDKSNTGKIIGIVMSKLKGKVEGQRVANLINKKLQTKTS